MTNAIITGSYGDPGETWPMMAKEWPNTPSETRLAAAAAAWQALKEHVPGAANQETDFVTMTDAAGNQYQFDASHTQTLEVSIRDQQSRDLVGINTCIQAMRMHRSTTDLFQLIDFHARPIDPDKRRAVAGLSDQQWYSGSVGTLLYAVAENADDAYSIGIAWERWEPSMPDKAEYVMTKLSRDQDWMGFNILLRNLKDVKFVCYADPYDPGVPGFAIGIPAQDNDTSNHHKGPFPPGQAAILRDLLLWHGAAECVWAGQAE